MKFNVIDDEVFIKSFMTEQPLFELANLDEDGKVKPEEWQPDPKFEYLLAYEGQVVYGFILFQNTTAVTIEAHIFIRPKYWARFKSYKVAKGAIKWLKENRNCKKVVTRLPDNQKHVVAFLRRLGFHLEGYSPKSIIWRGKLLGQYFYGMEVEKWEYSEEKKE